MALTHRLATRDDLPALAGLMEAAIGELQADFLSPGGYLASMGYDLAGCWTARLSASAVSSGNVGLIAMPEPSSRIRPGIRGSMRVKIRW